MVFMDVCISFRGRSHGGCGVMVVAHGGFCGGRLNWGGSDGGDGGDGGEASLGYVIVAKVVVVTSTVCFSKVVFKDGLLLC